ncbi:cytochrome c biogenesis protein (chloroplast) [Guillardia theta]|uniref:Cytochrome c biogenesis protein CcsA n=2 Tax=Guillardia theta TaxID=55529 RepID=CCSA_GUITH|nr:cytochrome c biogenesis protein [Guillardia theta]P22554.1 RecName: Full=Cytochrome c biogenesis protein CcsA [Guillardia theta]pir/S10456/ cytochrome c-type synthesis protein homolog - Cryptomonas sp. chloroplast [Cryptomonas sp.]AAC35630.1 c-type cytochrome synthesis protein [Guillardia theta]CAA36413.1 hypothetical protein [Guillardia theta]
MFNVQFDIFNFSNNITFLTLLISLISYWLGLIFKKIKNVFYIGYGSTILACITITIILGTRWIESGYFPLSNLYESLMFLTWGLLFSAIYLEYKTNLYLIGAIVSPISLFIVSFSTLSLPQDMQKAAPLVPALKSNWLMMHVSVMMLSYSTLIIGSLLAILYLVLIKAQQKKHSLKDFAFANLEFTFPKSTNSTNFNLLETLDNLSYRTIGFGFPLLTIGIIAGAVWANEAWGTYWSWDPKETWALITWLVFAAYLHARITKSWTGERPAYLAALGFVVVWICYLGVNFLGKGLHSYGWLN